MKNTSFKSTGKRIPRIAAVHDLSCFGRCALTVVIPKLSAMGVQTVPIPTALLSTHTGGFSDMYFEDLTDRMKSICDHLGDIGVDFDAIYTGFLGSEAQIEVVSRLIDRFGVDCPVFVDPVMGDDGELYSTYTLGMVGGMKHLCEKADIITPNLTEAFLLADMPYSADRKMSEKAATELCRTLFKKISAYCPAKTVITGLHFENDRVGTFVADENGGTIYSAPHIGKNYPGTGDLFASVMLGELIRGETLQKSAVRASDFTRETIAYSLNFPTNTREGVSFEPLLYKLCPKG